MLGRDQHFYSPALAGKIVPVVVLDVLRGGDLPEHDEARERSIGAVPLVLPHGDALLNVVHQQGVMEFGRADVQCGDTPTASREPTSVRIPADPVVEIERRSRCRVAANKAMFEGVPNVGPGEAADAFPRECFHQLEATTCTSEAVPVQTVLVKAVGCVDVRTKVKWADGADDQTLFAEDTHREVLFERAGSTRIDPHAALGRWRSACDVWSGISGGDDPWSHDLLGASHRCAQ